MKILKMKKMLQFQHRVSVQVKYRGAFRLVIFVTVVFVFVHFSACLWYYVARMSDFNIDTWVFRYGLMDKDKGHLYLVSFYWSLTTLTTVGYGDIAPKTMEEVILCTIWMFFGVGFYSYIISILTSVLTSVDSRQAALERKYKQLDLFAHEKWLPTSLVKSIKQNIFKHTDQVVLENTQIQELFRIIPQNLKIEIADQMYSKACNKVLFLYECNEAFKCSITPMLMYRQKDPF
jgi:hypothetical protein